MDEYDATFLRLDLHRKCRDWGVFQEEGMVRYEQAKATSKLGQALDKLLALKIGEHYGSRAFIPVVSGV